MIRNGVGLVIDQPIKNMIRSKQKAHGTSYGLSEVGYDLRLKQTITFYPPDPMRAFELFESRHSLPYSDVESLITKAFHGYVDVLDAETLVTRTFVGRTCLASSIEEFQIPGNLWCEFRNKSTHARRFIDATIGTDGEPGWNGFLTIEIIFHGIEPVVIPAGSGILKAVFHEIKEWSKYEGKYQNQVDKPVDAILD